MIHEALFNSAKRSDLSYRHEILVNSDLTIEKMIKESREISSDGMTCF